MKEAPNYYAVIPADVRYDNDLKDKAKLLYGEITALSDKYGYCYASNRYFAELYSVSQTTISLLIKNLIDNGYIESEIEYKDGSKEILNRYLKIIKGGYLRNLKEGYLKKVKGNNTSVNNTSINKENIKRKFIKPTIEEIELYCKERNNNINAKKFYEYYEVNNWKDKNGDQVKNWKQRIISWEGRNNKTQLKEDMELPEWFDKDFKKKETNLNELNDILKDFD